MAGGIFGALLGLGAIAAAVWGFIVLRRTGFIAKTVKRFQRRKSGIITRVNPLGSVAVPEVAPTLELQQVGKGQHRASFAPQDCAVPEENRMQRTLSMLRQSLRVKDEGKPLVGSHV